MRALHVKLFADGADVDEMWRLSAEPHIAGFTTNPTLMRKAGVTDYTSFVASAVQAIPDKPISFEVVADDLVTMDLQARALAKYGSNVYVKIPIMTTTGESTMTLVRQLSLSGVRVNVTAVMTFAQIREAVRAVAGLAPAIISVFAGRIADTGCDPVPYITTALTAATHFPNIQILWASPREVWNVYQADRVGCHIITATSDILQKLALGHKDLTTYSRETVRMFYDDARLAGLTL